VRGSMGDADVCILKRHGEGHVVPHLINYRANIMALYMLGIEKVVTTSAVGSLKKSIAPGSYALMDGFLDFTKMRVQTFFEVGKVVHTDMTHPYSAAVTDVLATRCPPWGFRFTRAKCTWRRKAHASNRHRKSACMRPWADRWSG